MWRQVLGTVCVECAIALTPRGTSLAAKVRSIAIDRVTPGTARTRILFDERLTVSILSLVVRIQFMSD
jgi:hypothetical protein